MKIKIKERNLVIITISIILIALFLIIRFFNKPTDFNLVESFSDSSFNGKINFNFVSVDKYDKDEMLKYAKEIEQKNITLDILRQNIPVITIVQFYKPQDTTSLNDTLRELIFRKYPHIFDPDSKLQCVENGYIFTGISKTYEDLTLPKDTLFSTTVIIPKSGIKAKDILKSQIDDNFENDSIKNN